MADRLTTPAPGEPVFPGAFATTHWTRVLASQGETVQAKQALSDLCAAYYNPVVAFLRREGRTEDAARELAHEFFAEVLARESFGRADPQRGRFRSYLLGALKHFLANQRVRASREKRGGNIAHQALMPETGAMEEDPLAVHSVSTPENLFDREWALNLLERALDSLRKEMEARGTVEEFEILKPWLTGQSAEATQKDAAARLNMSLSAIRVAIHRLRQRFRQLLKAEIAHTVNDPKEVAEEMRYLIQALS